MTEKNLLFAGNLRHLRLKNHLEQLELANLLGRKSASSVSEWEKGKYIPKADILKKIAEYFKVDLESLLNHDLTIDNYQLPTDSRSDIQTISEHLDAPHYKALLNYAQHLLKEQEAGQEK